MKNLLALLFLLILAPDVDAKPRTVRLDEELKYAKFIGIVVVDSYDGHGNIYFHSIEYVDTIHVALAHYNGLAGSLFPEPDSALMTGDWPLKGDKVLIVIDSVNKVSLFATQVESNFRFWSPFETYSLALFEFYSPATPLSEKDSMEKKGKYERCWDGCYLPVDQIKLYGK